MRSRRPRSFPLGRVGTADMQALNGRQLQIGGIHRSHGVRGTSPRHARCLTRDDHLFDMQHVACQGDLERTLISRYASVLHEISNEPNANRDGGIGNLQLEGSIVLRVRPGNRSRNRHLGGCDRLSRRLIENTSGE